MNLPSDQPVRALERLLAALEGSALSAPSRGSLQLQAVQAARRLPPGALAPSLAREIGARLRREVGPTPLPARLWAAPDAEIGVTYWLSGHDQAGAVYRPRIEARGGGQPPWPSFWPAPADEEAERGAERAFSLASELCGRRLAPLRGWHRVTWGDEVAAAELRGDSMGAALCLALISAWTRRPLPPQLAVTGGLDSAGRLSLSEGELQGLQAKVDALARERACVQVLYVPEGAEAGLRGPPALTIKPAADLEALLPDFGLQGPLRPRPLSPTLWLQGVDELRGLWEAGAVPALATLERAALLLDAREEAFPPERGPIPWRAQVAQAELTQLGCRAAGQSLGFAEARHWIERAELTARLRRLPPALEARLRAAQAAALTLGHHFERARACARLAVGAAQRAGELGIATRAEATIAEISLREGRADEALALLATLCDRVPEIAPWELGGLLGLRATALAQADRAPEAWQSLEEAERALCDSSPGPDLEAAARLRLGAKTLRVAWRLRGTEPPPEAAPHLATARALALGAHPSERLLHGRLIAWAAVEAFGRGALGEGDRWRQRLVRGLLRPEAGWEFSLGLAEAARLRLLWTRGHPHSEAQLRRLERWLARLPTTPEGPLAAPLRRLREELGASGGPPDPSALEELIAALSW